MNIRKAFTLIELLVVIAIIAILAAILFPVFAQAKAAAKASASLSNAKQETLGNIMYSGDADDVMVMDMYWGSGPVVTSGQNWTPWTWATMPYTKNADILQDPQGRGVTVAAGWPADLYKSLYPQYGFNNSHLSPASGGTPWVRTPVSFTGVAAPADTVMLAKLGGYHEMAANYWFGAGNGYVNRFTVESPDCYTAPGWCADNWGKGFYSDTIYANNKALGAFTGGVALRRGDQAVVTYVDGHASSKSPGALAAGTNWNAALASDQLVTNDKSKYIWDTE
jgi:prepilin-type N-terminal cleavage/methylation domain-containing protein